MFNRPGRLDRLVYVPLPDLACREQVLSLHLKRYPLDSEQHDNKRTDCGDSRSLFIRELAMRTDGYSGAELAMLCREAAMVSIRAAIAQSSKSQSMTITWRDATAALQVVKPRVPRYLTEFYSNYHKKK